MVGQLHPPCFRGDFYDSLNRPHETRASHAREAFPDSGRIQ